MNKRSTLGQLWQSFLCGFGSVFNIMPPPFESSRNEDVMIAIGEDFKAVGEDLQSALDKYKGTLSE